MQGDMPLHLNSVLVEREKNIHLLQFRAALALCEFANQSLAAEGDFSSLANSSSSECGQTFKVSESDCVRRLVRAKAHTNKPRGKDAACNLYTILISSLIWSS
jgi:hypothetical protein